MLQHFSELIDKVKAMPRTVVCVANADSETVEAARMALDKGLADVILYGDEAVVRPLVEQAGIEGRPNSAMPPIPRWRCGRPCARCAAGNPGYS